VLETGLEVRDQVVGQVFPAVVELADMRTQDSAPSLERRWA